MKRTVLSSLLLVFTLALVSVSGGIFAEEASDAPVAKVNGVTITRGELERGVKSYMAQIGLDIQAVRNPDTYKKMEKEVLANLVGEELLYQEARKKELLSDADLEEALKKIRGDFPSEDAFLGKVKATGFTLESFRAHVKRRLFMKRYVDHEIWPGISVSGDEIHGYYESNRERFRVPEQVRARHVLIRVDPRATRDEKEAARKKIEGILERARSGKDFALLARTYSQGPTAGKGGDLGFFSRGQMVRPFEEAAFALEAGEISDVVRTIYGFHIIKVEEHRESRVAKEHEVSETIRDFLGREKVRKAVDKKIDELRAAGGVKLLMTF